MALFAGSNLPDNWDDASVSSIAGAEGTDDIMADLENSHRASRNGSNGPPDDRASSSDHRESTPLAHRETQAVKRSKVLVYVVLCVAAAVVGTVTYLLLSKSETNNFEAQFQVFAQQILDAAVGNVLNTASVLESLATISTSSALQEGATWPMYSVPDFERRCIQERKLSGAELIATAHSVTGFQRSSFEEYAVANQGWINEGLRVQAMTDVDPGTISSTIQSNAEEVSRGVTTFLPLWQMAPAPTNASVVMQDLNNFDWVQAVAIGALQVGRPVISKVANVDFLLHFSEYKTNESHVHHHEEMEESLTPYADSSSHPRSIMVQPFYTSFETTAEVAGYILAVMHWDEYFTNILPANSSNYLVIVKDGCGGDFTYIVSDSEAYYYGPGDLHHARFNNLNKTAKLDAADDLVNAVKCIYTLSVYPTPQLEEKYKTSQPIWFAALVVLVFLFTAFVFAFYDFAVQRRQTKVLTTAERTTAIVSQMFPKGIQERILEEAEQEEARNNKNIAFAAKSQLKRFLDDESPNRSSIVHKSNPFQTKPIADLYPEVTLMFADMVGFTAWSSSREPSQVFTLLETVYHAFDEIMRSRRVFKVETVGDCYVAVAGLPTPRKDHAIVMARVARDCIHKMDQLTRELEEVLGPDTADLTIRVGLHSGPVTAGVLRGDRSRFQLFGDTVNTCARIESTGIKHKVHLSQATATLLMAGGKGQWVVPRTDKVHAKGKGELTTFWLEIIDNPTARSTSSGSNSGHALEEMVSHRALEVAEKPGPDSLSEHYRRLVNWNADMLAGVLRQILAHRQAVGKQPETMEVMTAAENDIKGHSRRCIAVGEIAEVITLPTYDAKTAGWEAVGAGVPLSEQVVEQLHLFVHTIAIAYPDNPFHNFAHVSHVTMSVAKLLSRIVAPDMEEETGSEAAVADQIKQLHDHTYGITSDPLTQFAALFAALIHDVDHPGVPNGQLIREKSPLAQVYQQRSMAEQNSLDIAWNLLMEDDFADLRRAIYSTEAELRRFRQLLVNAIMATDIMDPELGAARKQRWNRAFEHGYDPRPEGQQPDSATDIHRKATIVIEHLIQASDVAHTMQHWHVYCKWNANLFEEMYRAFLHGRAEKDPSETWYEGEIRFFDNYVIPLAKKLKDCGVFGVSSDECLNYAQQNREEWVRKGRTLVAEMREKMPRRSADL